jgi:hypothetical protein
VDYIAQVCSIGILGVSAALALIVLHYHLNCSPKNLALRIFTVQQKGNRDD